MLLQHTACGHLALYLSPFRIRAFPVGGLLEALLPWSTQNGPACLRSDPYVFPGNNGRRRVHFPCSAGEQLAQSERDGLRLESPLCTEKAVLNALYIRAKMTHFGDGVACTCTHSFSLSGVRRRAARYASDSGPAAPN
ncbi:hypothetical protein MTO96_002660 [Rhipicephalus appendiculatus]